MRHYSRIAMGFAFYAISGSLTLLLLVVLLRIFGPFLEMRYIVPVTELTFHTEECVGRDAIYSGVLDKTFYPGGAEARFLGLNLFDTDNPANLIRWRRVVDDDLSPESRPARVQNISVYAFEGCGRAFTAHTRHESPLTGFVLRMNFGPFLEGDDG